MPALTITQLIAQLEDLKKDFGDINIYVRDTCGQCDEIIPVVSLLLGGAKPYELAVILDTEKIETNFKN